jgi:hypothetical protein
MVREPVVPAKTVITGEGARRPSPRLTACRGRLRWDGEFLRLRAVLINKLMVEKWN